MATAPTTYPAPSKPHPKTHAPDPSPPLIFFYRNTILLLANRPPSRPDIQLHLGAAGAPSTWPPDVRPSGLIDMMPNPADRFPPLRVVLMHATLHQMLTDHVRRLTDCGDVGRLTDGRDVAHRP